MLKIVFKYCSLLIIVAFVIQLTACGTLIYPERQGQGKGEIDPGVAILDGAGLLFFLIPGLIAYIVDFSTGAIYLPAGRTSKERIDQLKGSGSFHIQEENGRVVILIDPDQLTPELIEMVVRTTTGVDYGINHPEIEVYRLDGQVCFPDQQHVFALNTKHALFPR